MAYTVDWLWGAFVSNAFAINGRGDIAGEILQPNGPRLGAVWDSSGLPPALLDENAFDRSLLHCINDAGMAAGTANLGAGGSEKPLLYQNGAAQDLTPVLGPGARCEDINAVGVVCGSVWTPRNASFILDTATTPPQLTKFAGLNPNADAAARAIERNGFFAGMSAAHAFVMRNGVAEDLGPAESVSDMNDQGMVVGWTLGGNPLRFTPTMWDTSRKPALKTEIPLPPGSDGGYAFGINNNGTVVGTCWQGPSFPGSLNANTQSAFLFDGSTSTDLNAFMPDAGQRAITATGINDRGQIVGQGLDHVFPWSFRLTPLDLHARPDLPLLLAEILFGVVQDGGGLIRVGGAPIPVPPRGWERLSREKQDILLALAIDELALRMHGTSARDAIRQASLANVRAGVDELLRRGPTASTRIAGPRRTALEKDMPRLEHAQRFPSGLPHAIYERRGPAKRKSRGRGKTR